MAEWEAAGKLQAVITQNIDGLHQRAGSRNVLELHGSVLRNYCVRCGAFHGVEAVQNSAGVPRCRCGGIIKPDVVLYEEGLDEDVLSRSVAAIRQAEGAEQMRKTLVAADWDFTFADSLCAR